MILMASSSHIKTISKPCRMWMRFSSAAELELEAARDHVLPELEELAQMPPGQAHGRDLLVIGRTRQVRLSGSARGRVLYRYDIQSAGRRRS